MFTRELLGLFPRKRIRAMDGMAVTAEIWEEAHDYHRTVDRVHTLLHHGAGIVAGLEVIASDPADNSVYVLPGLAVDPIGQSILVPEPRAYDLGGAEGALYLILTYTESRPQTANGRAGEDAPLYVYTQFTLEAVSTPPPTPYVELARVWRRGAGPIVAAKEANHPRANEIDLRFRKEIGKQTPDPVAVGVVTLRGAEGTNHGEGMSNVAAAMRYDSEAPVWVDRGVPLTNGLARYDLLYVVGRDGFQLNNDEMTTLYHYWQEGGSLFYEGCRRAQESGEPAADAAFVALLDSFGVQLRPVEAGHEVLRAPYLFGAPPDGFETRGTPTLRAGEGVLVSTFDYGCLWRGERRGRPAARSEIRNALEFGANLVTWAAARRAAQRKAEAEVR
jgi:hypothetical protein